MWEEGEGYSFSPPSSPPKSDMIQTGKAISVKQTGNPVGAGAAQWWREQLGAAGFWRWCCLSRRVGAKSSKDAPGRQACFSCGSSREYQTSPPPPPHHHHHHHHYHCLLPPPHSQTDTRPHRESSQTCVQSVAPFPRSPGPSGSRVLLRCAPSVLWPPPPPRPPSSCVTTRRTASRPF